MCINVCASHIFAERMIRLMSGEGECGQDTQLLLSMDVMSLEGHDVGAPSNHILEKADVGVCFRGSQTSSSWSICFVAVPPNERRRAQLSCLVKTLSPLKSVGN